MSLKYKSVEDVKRELEEEAKLEASGIGLLFLLGIYVLGMLLPYFIY